MRTRRKPKEEDREASETVCQHCGCGILDHEERTFQSMSGQFGCLLMYWHADEKACNRALLEKVRELEALVAKQAVALDRPGKENPWRG